MIWAYYCIASGAPQIKLQFLQYYFPRDAMDLDGNVVSTLAVHIYTQQLVVDNGCRKPGFPTIS